VNRRKKKYKCLLLIRFSLISFLLFQNVFSQSLGIWTSAEELQNIPMIGPAWEVLLQNANEADGNDAYISDQNYNNNVQILAAAIVYARTGLQEYKDKVITACEKLVSDGYPPAVPNTGRNDYNRTLAWGRETGAYVLAADLVGYRTTDFEQWCRNVAEVWEDTENNWTLLFTFKHRPNNWGTMAFGSLAAIYAYLQDDTRLNEIVNYWKAGVDGPNPGFSYGSDVSWHVDGNNLRLINPKGAVKNGLNIDGVYPDDMRRNGSFSNPPPYPSTDYHWEVQQGTVMAARILDRIGMSIWAYADSAIYRSAHIIEDIWAAEYGSSWKADGDDSWMLPFLDEAYGTDWVSTAATPDRVWKSGKNAGWGYVTLANKVKTVTVSVVGDGSVTLDRNEGVYFEGEIATLTADPSFGWVFDHWEGDLTGTDNPASVTIDGDKNITAVFVQSQTTQYTLTVVDSGSGNVSLSPPGGNYDAGTIVTLTANASSGWIFQYWSGDLSGNENPVSITMDSDKNVTAVFTQATVLPVISVIASTDDGNVPENTLDNDLNTRWSASGDGQWIQYDLGANYTVEYLSIAWFKGDQRSARFDIEISSDEINWTKVFSGNSSGTTTAQEVVEIPDTEGRYVKIVGHGNTSNDWNSITEVDIYGENITTYVNSIKLFSEYSILQNFPNPFNPSTSIIYELPKASYVTLKIYDMLGKEVRELINERKSAGMYKVMWDGLDNSGKEVSSGIYFYKITAGNFVDTKKMLLVR